MVQVLDANPRRSFAQQLNAGLDQAIPMWQNTMRQNQQREAGAKENAFLQNILGQDVSGASPEQKKLLLQSFLNEANESKKSQKGFDFENQLQDRKYGYEQIQERLRGQSRNEQAGLKDHVKQNQLNQKSSKELQEKITPIQNALQTVADMRKLRQTGKLGILSTWSPKSDTRKAAGEYAQLGKSLISMASNIPIRNKAEFETLAEGLYDPNITDATAEGTLNAMEKILSRALAEYQSEGSSFDNEPQGKPTLDHAPNSGMSVKKSGGKRPPLTSFQR